MPVAKEAADAHRPSARRQRGYVAAILLVFVTLGALAGLLSQLNSVSIARGLDVETGSGSLLGDARDALLGFAANHPDRPGGLPCPDTNDDGIAEAACDTEASRLGLLPWLTLGLPARPSADGEPLWYAVAPAYRVQATYPDPTFVINVASANPLNADRRPIQVRRPGVSGATLATDVAAVVIIPGTPLSTQTRPVGSVDVANPGRYLEGRNAAVADGDLFDIGDFGDTFNDRVVMLRFDELFDVVEPAIEQRLRSTVFWDEVRRHNHVPAQDATYPCTPTPCGSHRFLPFPVPFADPVINLYRDLAAVPSQGLMPVGLLSTDLVWTNMTAVHTGGPLGGASVAFAPQANRDLLITLAGAPNPVAMTRFDITVDLANAGHGFVKSVPLPATAAPNVTITGGPTLASTGTGATRLTFSVGFTSGASASVTLKAAELNPAFSLENAVAFGQPTAWFLRNGWYRFVYYAPAASALPGGSGSWACPGGCVSIAFPLTGAATVSKDAAIVYAGRALAAQNRAALPDAIASWLDTTENTNLDAAFESRFLRNVANDRVAYDPR